MFIKPKSVTNSCLELFIKGIYYLNICVTKNKIQWNLTFVDEVFCLPFIVLRLTFLWPPTVKKGSKTYRRKLRMPWREIRTEERFFENFSRSSMQTCYPCWPLSCWAVYVGAAKTFTPNTSLFFLPLFIKKLRTFVLKKTVLLLLETGHNEKR